MKNLIIATIVSSSLFFTGCKKDDTQPGTGTLEVKLSLTDGQNQVYDGETISLQNGYDIKISLFRAFLSNIMVQNTENEWVNLKDVVILDPGSQNSDARSFSVSMAARAYESIRFGLGVDSVMNEEVPSKFDNNHPLSSYQAMYWSMLKYRFAKFEGMANTSGNLGSSSDILLAFHPGTDPLYRTTEIPVSFSLKSGGTHTIELEIDLNRMFAGVGNKSFDFAVDNSTHSVPGNAKQIELATRFMDNLKGSLILK